jgi:hypothetical protein
MRALLFFIVALLGGGGLSIQSAPYSLAECAVNINGATTFLTRGGPIPSGVSLGDFNLATGLGSMTVTASGAGSHYLSVLLDAEIDEGFNTFYNEFAAVSGTPGQGQSWEIDEPGFRAGNLQSRFRDGTLRNVNNLPAGNPDDVAVAMGWNLMLSPEEMAVLQVNVSETAPATGFHLSQSDPLSGRTLFYSGTLRIQTGDFEPPSLSCPSALRLDADPGQCFRSNVTYSVTASDNLSGVSLSCHPASGSVFGAGTTAVLCTATDRAGNTNHCSFLVEVRPASPVMVCPANIIVECARPGGQPVDFQISAAASCGSNLTLTCVPPSGSVFPLGPTAVQCAAVDTLGARSECGFSVLLVGTNCQGEFSLTKSTCLAGEVHAEPLLHPYPCGTCVRVNGVAAGGWIFMGWLGDARGLGESAELTMTQSKCVEAIFGTRLTIVGADHGVGWLDPDVTLYPCGSPVRALARPEPGYFFAHWTNALTGNVNPTDFTLARTNAILTPVFFPLDPGEVALTIETRGYGRVIGQPRLANRYPAGSNVVLRAVPDAGQTFLGWSVLAGGMLSSGLGTNNPITVEMTTNHVITATFTSRPRIEIFRCEGRLLKDGFRFQVRGKLEDVYSIQATATLNGPIPWREIARATNTLGAVQYDDPYLPNVSQRFYRVELIEP